MSVREQQANDALRVLDHMHRLCRIERDEYRHRRRQVLESLSDPSECSDRTERDTVRRAVPAGAPTRMGAMERRYDVGEVGERASPKRASGLREAVLCLLIIAVVAGVAAVCWVAMTA